MGQKADTSHKGSFPGGGSREISTAPSQAQGLDGLVLESRKPSPSPDEHTAMLILLLPVSLGSVPQHWVAVGAMLMLLALLQGMESPEAE